MRVEKINNLVELTDEILELIKNDEFLCRETTNINRLVNTKSKLKNRKYTISVIAAMKAGKSTTFNALIGRDLLPNERAACTASITEIKHNKEESNYIEKIYVDGSKEKITSQNGMSLEEAFHEDVRNSRKKDGVKNIEKYYLETPIKALEGSAYEDLVQNFVLVDTPGPNEASTKDFDTSILQKLALDQLRNSDALIMLLDYESYKSEANAKILRDIFENRDDLENEQHKIYFLVNKIDSMRSKDGTVEDVIRNIQQLIKEYAPIIKNPKVYALSGRQAQFARCVMNNTATVDMKEEMKNDYGSLFADEIEFNGQKFTAVPDVENFAEQLFERSNLDTIEKEIISTVFENASDEMIDGAVQKISLVLENIIDNAESKIEVLNKDSEELYKVVSSAKEEVNKLKDKIEQLKEIPNKEFETLNKNIQNIIDDLQSRIIQSLELNLPQEDIIQSYDKNSLSVRMEDIKRNSLSAIQIVLNSELDKIQRLCIQSQYKLNADISKKFNKLVQEATKSVTEEINFTAKTFDIQESVDMYNDDADYIACDYETEGTYTNYEWDTKGAVTGVAAGVAVGATIGSFVPIIGTFVGGVIGGIGGLIFGSQKETTKEIQREIYTADISALKSSIVNNSSEILKQAKINIKENLNQFEKGYMKFLESEIEKFLIGLDNDLNKVINDYEKDKNNKEKEISHMTDIKFESAKLIDELENIKNL